MTEGGPAPLLAEKRACEVLERRTAKDKLVGVPAASGVAVDATKCHDPDDETVPTVALERVWILTGSLLACATLFTTVVKR
ncbi:hypothetical protein XA68_12302 [Ophiocordyceps unilateralis]|uniref:Uncharacterized protein n=1 Tax=Ophiocordyceps unilateralis TaxID=268505 RepID=A0A2A9PEY7_OPHUN|nr:hypothetical protein XA68_12302 [Ophiocordyceps unilateralis]